LVGEVELVERQPPAKVLLNAEPTELVGQLGVGPGDEERDHLPDEHEEGQARRPIRTRLRDGAGDLEWQEWPSQDAGGDAGREGSPGPEAHTGEDDR
jgi:hypothetical protein